MALDRHASAIGLTAPFGSGCTTAATLLNDRMQYHVCRISSQLVGVWRADHPNAEPTRKDLQELGDRLREEKDDPGFLVKRALEEIESLPETIGRVVFDGIRNTGEIAVLRGRFESRFHLFGIECRTSDRWERLKHRYANEQEFGADDRRDQSEENRHGQQVGLCMDQADVFLDNSDDVPLADFRDKLCEYVRLVTGERYRYARPIEILMNLAYSAAHGSKCVKRQVGAVLVAAGPGQMGDVVGLGFNENPPNTNPCVEEPEYGCDPSRDQPGMCYRDRVRYQVLRALAQEGRLCPACGEPLHEPAAEIPPWRCAACGIDLEEFFWIERAMSWCTAVHAEVVAIMAAGLRARGTTLYTTTFPCFQCAEKVAQAGIRHVVFTEPYPDIRAADRLEKAGIQVTQFEGVRSRRFDEIFAGARHAAQRRSI